MARRPPSPAVNGVAHRRVFDGENMGRYKFPSTHSSRVVSCACNVIQNRVADTSSALTEPLRIAASQSPACDGKFSRQGFASGNDFARRASQFAGKFPRARPAVTPSPQRQPTQSGKALITGTALHVVATGQAGRGC